MYQVSLHFFPILARCKVNVFTDLAYSFFRIESEREQWKALMREHQERAAEAEKYVCFRFEVFVSSLHHILL